MKNLNSNHMGKLEAYKQAKADYFFARNLANELKAELQAIGSIEISSSCTITMDYSSDKQLMFAVGILNSQLQACAELNMDHAEIESSKTKVLEFRRLKQSYQDWNKYTLELERYWDSIGDLLTNDEKFLLLEKPVKP
jgi:hypothetical protein